MKYIFKKCTKNTIFCASLHSQKLKSNFVRQAEYKFSFKPPHYTLEKSY